MKIRKNIPMSFYDQLVVLSAIAAICLPCFAQSTGEIEKLVANSLTYRYGQNRQNLNAIEETIRKTQSAEKRREIEKIFAKYLTNEQATVEFKEFVCRQLWYLGTAESVNSVATLLTNEQTIGWGCYALVRNPSKEATQALINALETVPQTQKAKIISALGQKRDPLAVKSISAYCENKDQEIATAAIIALGQIASKDSIQTLWKLTESSSRSISEQAAHSLILAAEHLAKSENQKEALDIYNRIYSLNFSPSVKAAAMRGLVQYSKDNGASFVLQNLKSEDPKTHVIAVGAISLMTNPQSIQTLIKTIPELPPSAQALVINAFAEKKEQTILPVVKSLVKSKDNQVKLECLRAMGKVGDSTCVIELVNAISSADQQEKSIAKESLSLLNSKDVDKEILNLLPKAQPETQIALIDVLLARSASAAVPQLIKICGQARPEIQKAALRAIGKLGEPGVIQETIKLIFNLNDPAARAEGEAAVVAIANKIPDKTARSSRVTKLWSTAENENTKESIIRIAAGIGDKNALEFLTKIATQEQNKLQDIAIRELSGWEDPDALPVLEKIYKNSKNPTHRALAFRSYVRLLKSSSNLSPEELFARYSEALQNAANVEEKKLVISGIATVPTIDALNLGLKMLSEESVKSEAAQAVVSVSSSILASEPNAAKNALNTLIASGISNDLRQQANLILKQIEEMGAYILKWEFAGPYFADGKNYDALFDIQFPPEQTKPDANVKWFTTPLPNNPKQPYIVDLLKIFGGEQRVAYARCYVYSPVQQKARLEIGSDDGIKIWLNGKVVYSLNVARPITPNSDKTDIVLNQGWNSLMFKITQNNLGWEFCARIVTPEGKILDGIKYSTTPE